MENCYAITFDMWYLTERALNVNFVVSMTGLRESKITLFTSFGKKVKSRYLFLFFSF